MAAWGARHRVAVRLHPTTPFPIDASRK
jgi:hypothetical protein